MQEGPDGPMEFLNSFLQTPNNYKNILQAFHARYSNKDLLSQAYQQDLQSIDVCFGDW